MKRSNIKRKKVPKKAKAYQKVNPLAQLVENADPKHLRSYIIKCCQNDPEQRRDWIDYLKPRVSIAPQDESTANAEIIWSLWNELEPDLSELDEYGGGDYGLEDAVGEQLSELAQRLEKLDTPLEERRFLLEEVLAYIKSNNAGQTDELYEVAYATCKNDEELRHFAKKLETLGSDWEIEHARRIYRDIKDDDDYLRLRFRKLKYGLDYHDLATFHKRKRQHSKAQEVIADGLEKAEGRMDELRALACEYAEKSGNRDSLVAIQFEQAIDRLSKSSYNKFKKFCRKKEWEVYEPKILKAVQKADKETRLEIHMQRKEHEMAAKLLSTMRYSTAFFNQSSVKIAEQLEIDYPEEVIAYYNGGLKGQARPRSRKDYAEEAKLVYKIRRVCLQGFKDKERWLRFVRKLKQMNHGRPAFQQEFKKAIPHWNSY